MTSKTWLVKTCLGLKYAEQTFGVCMCTWVLNLLYRLIAFKWWTLFTWVTRLSLHTLIHKDKWSLGFGVEWAHGCYFIMVLNLEYSTDSIYIKRRLNIFKFWTWMVYASNFKGQLNLNEFKVLDRWMFHGLQNFKCWLYLVS